MCSSKGQTSSGGPPSPGGVPPAINAAYWAHGPGKPGGDGKPRAEIPDSEKDLTPTGFDTGFRDIAQDMPGLKQLGA